MATPLLHQVRCLFPNAHITALAHEPIAELLEGITDVDEFLPFSRAKGRKLQEERRITRLLKNRHFDLGILLTQSFSSAWMFWKGRIRLRLGMCHHFRKWLLNIPVPKPQEEQHDVLSYSHLLSPFHAVLPLGDLSLSIKAEEQDRMRERLFHLGKEPHQKLIIINAGAAYGSAKCWPHEYFKTVACHMSKEGHCCLFVGDAKLLPSLPELMPSSANSQKELLGISTSIHNASGPIISLVGQTSLRDLMAAFSIADCVVSNDSGPMHIAAAFKRPLVALFGSTNPYRTGPWKCGKVLYKQVACSPCYLRTCPIDFRCMRRIYPNEVIDAIHEEMGHHG
jgi:heptosyltransferase-2